MTSQPLWGKYCDGGHFCSTPKECCTLGCCYYPPQTNKMFNLLFLGHWYFWAVVTAAIVCLLCFCSLWRRYNILLHVLCCFGANRDDRTSEPDSAGSFYAPPQYSRCNSFHHVPPPYTEVTSKPDLYPLVISYNGESGMKHGESASYLMVQYFRNYILRPSGSISATSTIDSLNSSFICNATNTLVPPPYSCTGSLDGFNISANTTTVTDMLNFASGIMCNENQQFPSSSDNAKHDLQSMSNNSNRSKNNLYMQNTGYNGLHSNPIQVSASISSNEQAYCNESSDYNNDNSIFFANMDRNSKQDYTARVINSISNVEPLMKQMDKDVIQQNSDICSNLKHFHITSQTQKQDNIISIDHDNDSETSQCSQHNFSKLHGLSLCGPTEIMDCDINGFAGVDLQANNFSEFQQSCSFANSITISDISSLTNLGTPDSPPRATSPTVEIRELLDKIQQLPYKKKSIPEHINYAEVPQSSKSIKFLIKNKSKTFYVPLNSSTIKKPTPSTRQSPGLFPNSSSIFNCAGKTTKSWLPRSAPSTPCSSFIPLFQTQRKMFGSQKGSKQKIEDGNALLGNSNDDHKNSDACL